MINYKHLHYFHAVATHGTVARAAEEKSMTAQLVGKMLAFFGVKRRNGMTANELAENASISPFS